MYDPLCLVMELPANGDLLSYLINCRQEVREGGEGVRERGVGGREGGREGGRYLIHGYCLLVGTNISSSH